VKRLVPVSVITSARFPVPAALAWERLLLFEEIERKAPFLLRAVLPSPIGTSGSKAPVDARTLCRYREGVLVKRVTDIAAPHRWRFEVEEQGFAIAGGARLLGGGYALRDLPDGGSEVALETRYAAALRPRWLWRRLEAAFCHAFHRHLLAAMSEGPWAELAAPGPSLSSPLPSRRLQASGRS